MHIPEDEAERRRLNERGREILRRKNGAVRPHREDGYVNLLNKYGTKQDNSEAYKFEREPVIPDMQLTGLYEGNGLFSKIIDTPAEEALKHGFDLNLKSDELNAFVEDALDDLEWEEKAATAKEGMDEDTRVVLHLPPLVAPIQVAVLPLSKKLKEPAYALYKEIDRHFRCEYDETGSVGKRYRRQDEIGTPFSVTFDFDSANDNAVTVRNRDTMEQERVNVTQLRDYLEKQIEA